MEKQIKDAFAELEMSHTCAERIKDSLRQHRRTSGWIRYAAVATACLVLLAVILTSPNVAEALENVIVDLRKPEETAVPTESVEIEKHTYRDSNFEDGYGHDEDGNRVHVGSMNTGNADWLKITEDGVYFIGNGENIEIGSLMSTEAPFTYVYTDSVGVLHYIAVGNYIGKDGEVLVGWHEWLREADKAGGGRFEGWFGGGGMIPNSETETWGWLEAAKEQFDVPWGR